MGAGRAGEKAGDPQVKDKKEDELKKEYQAIASAACVLASCCRKLAVSITLPSPAKNFRQAVMQQARVSGQEDKVFEFLRKNLQQVDELKGPILEEKAVDFILEKVAQGTKVTIAELLEEEDEGETKEKAKSLRRKS